MSKATDFSIFFAKLKTLKEKFYYYTQSSNLYDDKTMQHVSFNSAVFIFMERGEKLTHDAIWNGRLRSDNRYVLWPRGECRDV